MNARVPLLLVLACVYANARTPDGTLGALQLPNNVRPAIAPAGTAFDVEARQQGALKLVGADAEFPLAPAWATTPRGTTHATITLPADVPAGTYALEWSQGGETDRNDRAVYVPAPDPQSNSISRQYAFACIAFAPDGSDAAKTAAAANAIDAAQTQFVIAFVPNAEDRYPEILAALDTCAAPTLAVADAPPSVCERWFGPPTFTFRFGPDAFLAPAAGNVGLGDNLGPAVGELARLRVAAKTARWTTGLFAGHAPAMSMRNEITLFVDDPLPICIFAPTTTNAPPIQPPAWAGWFEPPRAVTLTPGAAIAFAANRKGISPQKPAPAAHATTKETKDVKGGPKRGPAR